MTLVSFNSFAKEYTCDSLTWVSPYGQNRYAMDVKVVVKDNNIQLDVVDRGDKSSHYVTSGKRDAYFKSSPYKTTALTKKYGFETERTIIAYNDKRSVEFVSNLVGLGYVEYKTGTGYGFYGKCS